MASYTRQEQIGEGGFGEVWLAVRDDGLACAMKRLKVPCSDDIRRRFVRETKLQSNLKHPNVMPIIGMNTTADVPFFVMPLASGSLRDRMADEVDQNSMVGVFIDILDGVAHAHANGVIHGDIKPENVMFVEDDDPFSDTCEQQIPVVSDFGLCRATCRDTTTITLTGEGMGTAWYVAPEQWDNFKERDEKADIYSLGRMFYEMLTNSRPGILDIQALPSNCRYVIAHSTEQNPANRYESVQQLRSDLLFATQNPAQLASAQTELSELVDAVLSSDQPAQASVQRIIRLFIENSDDYSFLQQLCQLPAPLAQIMITADHTMFRDLVEIFDDAVSGSLSFEFTDLVADFYARVWHATEDLGLRRMIVHRLNDMGWRHNRFHVGNVLAGLIHEVHDTDLAMAVRDGLNRNAQAISFVRSRVSLAQLPPLLRDCIADQ